MGRIKTIIITIFLSASSFVFAEFNSSDSTNLEHIQTWTRAMDVVISEFLGADKDDHPEQNMPSYTIDDFYARELVISQNTGYTYERLNQFYHDMMARNRHNSISLTNIIELLESQNLDLSVNTNILEELTAFHDEWVYFYNATQGQYSGYLRPIRSTLSTIDSRIKNLNLGEIVTNQYEQISQFNDLAEFLGIPNYTLDEYFLSLRHGTTDDWKTSTLSGVTYHIRELEDILHSITNLMVEEEQDTSELSPISDIADDYLHAGDYIISEYAHLPDTTYNYLTNVSAQAQITQIEYDFFPYTNVSTVIDNIKEEHYYNQMMSETNQFVSASTSVTDALNRQVESIEPLFKRQYDSDIVINWDLLGVHNEIDLADYVKFDSDKLKLCWDFVIWISTILFGLKALKSIWEN